MTAQSWPVPVIEYGIVAVSVAPFFLLLRLRLGAVFPHRLCCAISPLPLYSWGVPGAEKRLRIVYRDRRTPWAIAAYVAKSTFLYVVMFCFLPGMS